MGWSSNFGWSTRQKWSHVFSFSSIADVLWNYRSDPQVSNVGGDNHIAKLNNAEAGFVTTVVIANTSFANTDKRFWGITCTTVSSSAGIASGLAISSVGQVGATVPFGMSHSGAALGSTGGNTFGLAVGINPALMAWDGTRQAFYIYSAGLGAWGGSSGTDNPITGTGGAIPSAAIGTPIFPVLQLVNAGDVVVINGGLQTFDATLTSQVTALKGAGYKELGAP